MSQERSAPRYWSRHPQSRAWMVERFGTLRTLNPDEPVRHVSLFEAQARCAPGGAPAARRGGVGAGCRAEPRHGLGHGAGMDRHPYEPYAGFLSPSPPTRG